MSTLDNHDLDTLADLSGDEIREKMGQAPTRPTFTPGPWQVDPRDAQRVVTVAPDRDHMIIVAECYGRTETSRDDYANARLVASAPAMYAALRHIAYEPLGHADATHAEALAVATDLARAVLAKADGR